MIDLNAKAKEIFEQNKAVGWWDDMNRCIYQTLQLINTEIAEATEGARKNLMDDHLPHRKMEEVELADVLIRTLDLGGRCGWLWYESEQGYGGDVFPQINGKFKSSGAKHLLLSVMVSQLAESVIAGDGYNVDLSEEHNDYSALINTTLLIASSLDYDIISAMNEKIEYNKKRADHKRENRKGEAGQKEF